MDKALSEIKEEIQKIIDYVELKMEEIGFEKLEGCEIFQELINKKIKNHKNGV